MKRRNNERFLWFTTALGGRIGCHWDKIKSLSPDELVLTDGRRFQLQRIDSVKQHVLSLAWARGE